MATAINTTRRQRRTIRAMAPLAGLLIAALLVWQGSNAAFSAVSDNNGNQWATGGMTLENNGGGASWAINSTPALFNNLTGLKPGATGTECITVRSTGSIGGDLRFYVRNVDAADTLAGALQLTVQRASVSSAVQDNCTGFPGSGVTTVHNNVLLGGLPTTYAAAAAGATVPDAGGMVAYRITWTVPSSADNTFQNKAADFDLVWELN